MNTSKKRGTWDSILADIHALIEKTPNWDSQHTYNTLICRQERRYVRLRQHQTSFLVETGIAPADAAEFSSINWASHQMIISLTNSLMDYSIISRVEDESLCIVCIIYNNYYPSQILLGNIITHDTWEGGTFVSLINSEEESIPAMGSRVSLSIFRDQIWTHDGWVSLGWEQGFLAPLLCVSKQAIVPPLLPFPVIKVGSVETSSFWGYLPCIRLLRLRNDTTIEEVSKSYGGHFQFFPSYEKEGNIWSIAYKNAYE